MKTIIIKEAFSTYVGAKLREFTAGEEVEVADDLAANLIEKGLASQKADEPKVEAQKPVAKAGTREAKPA